LKILVVDLKRRMAFKRWGIISEAKSYDLDQNL